ncbi:MAG: geranylgeranyl reductase family protein [Candidatus Caldatribacteriota bacterium]
MEIVIVGAGPVGCYTARLLRKYGIKAKLIEEHQEVGKPVQCAGIVGKQVFEDTQGEVPKSSIINQINGAFFFYGKDNFKINREGVALVIDREKFDQELSRGLDIELGTRLLNLETNGEGKGYLLRTNKGELKAEVVIGADGAKSRVRRFVLNSRIKLSENNLEKKNRNQENSLEKSLTQKIDYYQGWQYRVKLEKPFIPKDFVQVYLEEAIPFFIWIIPESEYVVRIGIISWDNRNKLNQFLQKEKIEGEIMEKNYGIIPLGLLPRISWGKVFLVGDAACQIKPLTGGGIYYGLKAAEILVDCLRENKLVEYEIRWKRKYCQEIRKTLRLRRIYERIQTQPDEIKEIFNLFKNNVDFIEKIADFENHSEIFREVFKIKRGKLFVDAIKILGRNLGRIIFAG